MSTPSAALGAWLAILLSVSACNAGGPGVSGVGAVGAMGAALPPLVGETDGVGPSIAVGPDGAPVVAWSAPGSDTRPGSIVVQRWSGSAWVKLGAFQDAPIAGAFSRDANVAVDKTGKVLVAWTEHNLGVSVVHVRALSGATWQAWPDVANAYRPYLVVDDADQVSMSVTAGPGDDHAAVFRLEAGVWKSLGDLMNLNGPGIQGTGNMAGDAAGALEVVWSDLGATAQFAPQRRRWEGGAWQTLVAGPGAGVTSAQGPSDFRVAVSPAGAVAFGWWDGSTASVFMPAWPAPQRIDTFTVVETTDLDVDPTGRSCVTFISETPEALQVQCWSGTKWEALFDSVHVDPAPDATRDGDLAFSSEGKPFLALEERARGRVSIYVLTTPD